MCDVTFPTSPTYAITSFVVTSVTVTSTSVTYYATVQASLNSGSIGQKNLGLIISSSNCTPTTSNSSIVSLTSTASGTATATTYISFVFTRTSSLVTSGTFYAWMVGGSNTDFSVTDSPISGYITVAASYTDAGTDSFVVSYATTTTTGSDGTVTTNTNQTISTVTPSDAS